MSGASVIEAAPQAPLAQVRRRGREVPIVPTAKFSGELMRWTLCVVPVLALLIVWSVRNGGYDSTTWLASGVGLVVLAVWARLAFGASHRLGRFGLIALGALGLYTLWSFTSILWATDKGTALIGSDRTLLFLLIFWLFAHVDWTERRLESGLSVYAFGIGVFAAGTLLELALAPAPQLLQRGELAAGLGYHNATAALGTMGAGIAIVLGSLRERSVVARVGLSAVAVGCLEISLLAQSRGWLYTLPVIAVIVFALTPNRGRVLLWALIPVGCAVATLPWVLHGWAVADGAAGHQTVAAADELTARVALVAMLVSGAGAALLALGQRRFRLSRRGRRLARRGSRVLAAGAILGTAGIAIEALHSGLVARGWHQFTTNAPLRKGVSRFAELGSGRYDMWRVGMHSFAAHPLGGLGQDNFAQAYVAGRHTGEEPLWVHSLELRLLAHTGLVGAVLFFAFLAFALLAYRRAARMSDRRLRLALAAALVPAVVWVVHGSEDWFWELPALSGAAFAFLGAAVALEPGRGVPEAGGIRRRAGIDRALRLMPAVGAAAFAGIALWVMGTAYLGEHALAQARALAAVRPAAALRELSLAADYEPLDGAPMTLGAALELRGGQATSALRWTQAGLRRDPGDWVLWLENAIANGALGHSAAEAAAFRHAHTLDPREPVIALAQRRARTSTPLTITQAASMLTSRAQARVAP